MLLSLRGFRKIYFAHNFPCVSSGFANGPELATAFCDTFTIPLGLSCAFWVSTQDTSRDLYRMWVTTVLVLNMCSKNSIEHAMRVKRHIHVLELFLSDCFLRSRSSDVVWNLPSKMIRRPLFFVKRYWRNEHNNNVDSQRMTPQKHHPKYNTWSVRGGSWLKRRRGVSKKDGKRKKFIVFETPLIHAWMSLSKSVCRLLRFPAVCKTRQA
jgi:hypothetical protein